MQTDNLQINAKSSMLEDTNPDADCRYLVRNIYAKKAKKFREKFPNKECSEVGTYRLRRADRYDNTRVYLRVSTEVSKSKQVYIM